MLKHNML